MNSKLILCLALVAFNLSTQARGVRSWTDAELQKPSDLIVIASPITTKDLDETNSLGWPQSESFRPQFRGVETTFKVFDVLKGAPANDQIILHHYRFEKEWINPANGPSLMDFASGDTNEYLLYLVKDGTNRYAPVAGQVDPGLSINTPRPGTNFDRLNFQENERHPQILLSLGGSNMPPEVSVIDSATQINHNPVAESVCVSNIEITFAKSPSVPALNLTVEVMYPPGRDNKEHGAFTNIVAGHVASLNVTWVDPKRFKSENQTRNFLRELLCKTNTETWMYHIWSWGDGQPSVVAAVSHTNGKQGAWIIWCSHDTYWAYKDENGKWWWSVDTVSNNQKSEKP